MSGVWMKPWAFRRSHREPATREEKLASMRRELANWERVYGMEHPLTKAQREAIKREEGKC